MSCFYTHKGKLEVLAGTTIQVALRDAAALSARNRRGVSFEFNQVIITVGYDSNLSAIERDFMRAMAGMISGPIGPYPPELTDADRANDARVQAETERRRAEAELAYQKQQDEKRKSVEARLANSSEIELKDAAFWETQKRINSDPYGGAVISYAECWARLMQVDMAAGKKIAQIASPCSDEANIEGITGFMYGCAVTVLSKCWKHGEAFTAIWGSLN